MTQPDRVLVETTDGIAHVKLNRADKMNALDGAMFEALSEAGSALAGDRQLRAVVLSGEGRCFCAGLDASNFAAMAGGGGNDVQRSGGNSPGLLAPYPDSIATRAQHVGWVWQEIPVPVIAAVHGVCFGGGFQIAMGADIRFVTPDVRLSILEIKWGLIPDMSGTQTLRHLLPLDVVKELTWTGREVGGAEAVELGLATRVADDPVASALELARTIAGKSPDAIRAGKQLLNASGLVSTEEGLRLEARLQAKLIAKPNQIESIKSNLEKRAPKFEDPTIE